MNEYIGKIKEFNKKPLKVRVITHGCQMNEHDTEKIIWLLDKMDFEFTQSNEEADLVIINTCSIRHSAEDKVYGQLGVLKHLKENRPELKVAVCGCMMQREESREYVMKTHKHVNIIFGTNNIHRLPELLYRSFEGEKFVVDIEERFSEIDDNLGANRLYSYKSYVNIMYGCNNFCTYCIVPYTRGREVSRPMADILNEIKALAQTGTKEVTLLGQNVNSYGKTLSKPVSFARLLREVNEIEGIERIRFMTSHPKDISDELIKSFASLDHLCNFLHLPVQAGSSRVLQLMNRKYTKEEYLRKIDKIKNVKPDIALSTDLMVGFPGETEEDFKETLDLVQRVEYDTAFTFIYSLREGTPAARSQQQISDQVKHDRFERLLDILYPIQWAKNKLYQGQNIKVLAEDFSKRDPQKLTGRSEEFKLVNFTGDSSDIGNIVDVKITDFNSFALEGERI